MLCVQKMAYRPAMPRFKGRLTSKLMAATMMKTVIFAIRMANRKCQFTFKMIVFPSGMK